MISDIISNAIEKEFSKQIEYLESKSNKKISDVNIDRLQDDWWVGTSTLEEAETVLSLISRCYRDYGLDINGNKTSISRIVEHPKSEWISEIRLYLYAGGGGLKGRKFEDFLDRTLKIQSNYPNEPVINYVLSIIESNLFGLEDVAALESFLMKSANISPISMENICRIILNIQELGIKISKEQLSNRFNDLFVSNFENQNNYECIWILHLIRGLRKSIKIDSKNIDIENLKGSIMPIMLLDMDHKGLVDGVLPIQEWEREVRPDRILTDWSWLFAYEATRRNWINDPNGVLRTPFFAPLLSKSVCFYDEKRNIARSKNYLKLKANRRKANLSVMLRVMGHLRGLHGVLDST